MKQPSHLLLALFLGTTATLSACDSRYTPGVDPQRVNDFNISSAPPARKMEIYADSINYRQNVQPPAGKGSAADIGTSVDAQLESAPSGNSATSPQAPSGVLNSPPQKSTNGNGTNSNESTPASQQPTQK
ncbi:hypothetical protein [Hymenobacter sp. GOD-10R]|uniref:hypothetical protein n=1 Tax=Hymenobacter sp. GOD-10R TaxID=3093922 RepID=UPI002D7A076B|nr:hypothetical protein [Hymenobacter sp. GOD-10R]WRQ29978.1 hypothetical protein SD425_06825 [Hymenobacter sp. GOD-10R]